MDAAGFEPAIISDGESLQGFEPYRSHLLEIKVGRDSHAVSLLKHGPTVRFRIRSRESLAHGGERIHSLNRLCAHILPKKIEFITEKSLRE